MITIVNYGVGNLASVQNMLHRAGARSKISADPDDILASEKILLPGVGSFDYGMEMLHRSGVYEAINHFAVVLRRPVLGICLGAQILGHGSEEGIANGLGWIDMKCRRIPAAPGLRVPHMGWGEISICKESEILNLMVPDARYYFAHSYYMDCANSSNIIATTRYGVDFACVVQAGNIYGTQFHPEKSLRHGLAVMKAFAELTGHE